MLLLAAVHETGLLPTLTAALAAPAPTAPRRLTRMLPATIQHLLLTLLFLGVVGLRRTWELRTYTGTALALLTGRVWAYGYRHVERFLAALAQANVVEPLTDALARWTARLWLAPADTDAPLITVYSDGHRKAVYTDQRIPRGLIGKTGKILGCRALVLLHDAHGHPLLVTTQRGDTHLTLGLPQILARYEQAIGRRLITRIVVDREGMSAAFLTSLVADGRTVITLLRSDQYTGLDSFTDVGPFVPFTTDPTGTVIREVASAQFALPLPGSPGEFLPVQVALIRDLRRTSSVPPAASDDRPPRWDADLSWSERDWHADGWVATPAPVRATMAKLIPIIATAEIGDALTLARTYCQRWPLQENVIRDFLIPLGIETNHGYHKQAVGNSEVAKRRGALEARLATLKRWAQRAGERCRQASTRYQKLLAAGKARAGEWSARLWQRQRDLEAQEVAEGVFRQEMRAAKEVADADMAVHTAASWRAYDTSTAEYAKQERYCKDQRTVLRALADLAAREPPMYEVDNAKDQIMTVCKVALTNLVMWTRDQYFPPSYAHATWSRLNPFFKLPGQVVVERDCVRVSLRPFNDRQLNRDLRAVCAQVAAKAPRLPDGRQLILTVWSAPRPILDIPP